MLQKYNKWAVLKVFFDDPSREGRFQLREISRKVGLATPSVKKYLNELAKEELIVKSRHGARGYPVYWANRESPRFMLFKKIETIVSINDSGLLDYLSEKCMPEAIILFGSASRGEDMKDSDIDLFLLCMERKLELEKFEKKLNRKINIFFTEDFSKLNKELRNNIINGIVLKGYLKVF